ncbi:MAG: transposon-transfer assisting family protein [Clostridium sp.]
MEWVVSCNGWLPAFLIWQIRRIMPYIKDSDMEDLSRQVLRKLDGMTDKEFAENSLEAVEE